MVGIQVTVDSSGRVARIGSSVRAISTPGRMSAEFLAVVESAVEQWRFVPAEVRRLKPVTGKEGKEDYWLVTRADKTDYSFDVVFTFTATGEVTSGMVK